MNMNKKKVKRDKEEPIEVVTELDKEILNQILKMYDKTFKDLVNK